MKLKQVSAYKVWALSYDCRCGECDRCDCDGSTDGPVEPAFICYTPSEELAQKASEAIENDIDEDEEINFNLLIEETLIEVTDNENVDMIMLTVEDIKACFEDMLDAC